MTDETREHVIRTNSTDMKYIRLAQEELGDVPLGRAAREGAKRIISESQNNDDSDEVTIA
ncbi:hypothetical protein [Halobacterium salinarum]|uniref:hypothetical protein n=1 Tax=Halobacterium salinarum TaxID=2242 RepID=UPI00255394DE|nr:hypothetical protein [Halobacterium salinarum]MDL0145303.1 hypothetical protein [Halobacterium salinarum]